MAIALRAAQQLSRMFLYLLWTAQAGQDRTRVRDLQASP